MKSKFYNIKKEYLFEVAAEYLPRGAVVWFAYQRRIDEPYGDKRYGIICYYEFKKRFYGLMMGRLISGDTITPWKRESFMFNPNSNDDRFHLEAELHRAEQMRVKNAKPEDAFRKTIFETTLEGMIEQERLWKSEESESPKAPIHAET